MDHITIAQELERNKGVFERILAGLGPEQYLWKPEPAKWCLLEIVCHLYDEEREDFRQRVQLVLQDPALPLPPIDPKGWVDSRKYLEQDYELMLNNFLAEREISVSFLRSLEAPKWANIYQHPVLGAMPASLFLHNWLAHDYHHLRQINELRYLFLKAHSDDALTYAGNW